MLQYVFIKEDNSDRLNTKAYTTLKEALASEDLSRLYLTVRKILLTGKYFTYKSITFKKIKLNHLKYGRTNSK